MQVPMLVQPWGTSVHLGIPAIDFPRAENSSLSGHSRNSFLELPTPYLTFVTSQCTKTNDSRSLGRKQQRKEDESGEFVARLAMTVPLPGIAGCGEGARMPDRNMFYPPCSSYSFYMPRVSNSQMAG